MYAALFAILAALRKPNSQRGAWMKLFKHSKSYARTSPEISRWGAGFVAILMILAGMAITTVAQGQAPKRTVIRAGRVLNVRTGELRANQAIVIEGDKISQISPSAEVKTAVGDTTKFCRLQSRSPDSR